MKWNNYNYDIDAFAFVQLNGFVQLCTIVKIIDMTCVTLCIISFWLVHLFVLWLTQVDIDHIFQIYLWHDIDVLIDFVQLSITL